MQHFTFLGSDLYSTKPDGDGALCSETCQLNDKLLPALITLW